MNFIPHIGDAGTQYNVAFTTSEESTREWVQVSFGFDEFGLAPWQEEASEPFDLTRVKSYGCERQDVRARCRRCCGSMMCG